MRRCFSLFCSASPLLENIRLCVPCSRKAEPLPISQLSRRISDEDLEQLAEEHGGLLSFLRRHTQHFDVRQSASGVWAVARIPDHTQATSRATPPQKAALAPRVRLFKDQHNLLVPPRAVPLSALAQRCHVTLSALSAEVAATNAGRVVCCLGEALFIPLRLVAGGGGGGGGAQDPNSNNRSPNAVDAADATWDEWAVPSYDIFRLARYLNCDAPVSMDDLQQTAQQFLTQPVSLVVLADWQRLVPVFTHPYAPKTEMPNATSSLHIAPDATTQLPSFDPSALPLPQALQHPSSPSTSAGSAACDPFSAAAVGDATEMLPQLPLLHGVRYVLDEGVLDKEAKMHASLADEPTSVIEARLRSVNKDFQGFKAIKERRKLLKASLRRRFPRGNPLMDPPVTAHLFYDLMENTTGYVKSSTVRAMLPDGGRIGCATNNDFFAAFPSLFNLQCETSTDALVQRADCGPKTAPALNKTEGELILEVAAAFPAVIDPQRLMSISFISSRCSTSAMTQIKRDFSSLAAFLRRFPSVFEVSAVEVGPEATLKTSEDRLRGWAGAAAANLGSTGSKR